ncbi:MAG: penicillin-binding protein 2 [Candidatus Cloacimonadaceae bacterium]
MDRLNLHHYFRIIIGLIFTVLIVALFRLQVVQGGYYKQIAESNFVRLRRIIATRGEIYDHKYRPIVQNVPSQNLYLIPGRIGSFQSLADFLEQEFGVTMEELRQHIEKTRFRSYEDILITENISYETVLTLSEKLNYFPELFFRTETTRNYVYPNHFTGYVGRINEGEYQKYKTEDYTINSQIGKTGLEKFYEVLVKGRDGREIIQVDAMGRNLNLFKAESTIEPENGMSLVLTIDNDIQSYAESIFPSGMRGAIVAMDVTTGGILAYVSKPSFDPNLFMTKISVEDWQAMNDDVTRPMLDRVIHAAYPPGSVFKTITAGAGLEKGVINEFALLENCVGGMQVGNRFFKCWTSYGHGRSILNTALKVSCDVYFYDLSLKLKLEDFYHYAHQSLLGQRTGIDLPNERSGLFPNTEWYHKNYGQRISIVGHKVNLAIGQGEVLTTPLQICALYSAYANNGIWIQPHLLQKTVGKSTIQREQINPVSKAKLPLSQHNLALIQKGLYSVCNEPGGTATRVQVKGATTYGKTGSAENVSGRATHAWFAGYIVTEKPEICVTVFLENAGHGGSIAAPLATQILNFYMGNYQTIKAPAQVPVQFRDASAEDDELIETQTVPEIVIPELQIGNGEND